MSGHAAATSNGYGGAAISASQRAMDAMGNAASMSATGHASMAQIATLLDAYQIPAEERLPLVEKHLAQLRQQQLLLDQQRQQRHLLLYHLQQQSAAQTTLDQKRAELKEVLHGPYPSQPLQQGEDLHPQPTEPSSSWYGGEALPTSDGLRGGEGETPLGGHAPLQPHTGEMDFLQLQQMLMNNRVDGQPSLLDPSLLQSLFGPSDGTQLQGGVSGSGGDVTLGSHTAWDQQGTYDYPSVPAMYTDLGTHATEVESPPEPQYRYRRTSSGASSTVPALPGQPAPKQPRKRNRTTTEQLHILLHAFEQESMPNSKLRTELAHRTGMEPRQIQIWFQNRRAKLKHAGSGGKHGGTPLSASAHRSLQTSYNGYNTNTHGGLLFPGRPDSPTTNLYHAQTAAASHYPPYLTTYDLASMDPVTQNAMFAAAMAAATAPNTNHGSTFPDGIQASYHYPLAQHALSMQPQAQQVYVPPAHTDQSMDALIYTDPRQPAMDPQEHPAIPTAPSATLPLPVPTPPAAAPLPVADVPATPSPRSGMPLPLPQEPARLAPLPLPPVHTSGKALCHSVCQDMRSHSLR